MSIEIKQMQVTASVAEDQRKGPDKDSRDREKELESVKQPILADCKELFYDLLSLEKER